MNTTSQQNVDGDLLDLAYTWGLEDGQSGESQRGSLYFPLDSLAYSSYNEGYRCGRMWSGGPVA